MKSIRSVITNHQPGSFLYRIRRKRFRFFIELISKLKKPIRVLDAGGDIFFWEQMGYANSNKFSITLLNIYDVKKENNRFSFINENAANLDKAIDPKQFDLVFSNSMIEHMSFSEQTKFAKAVRELKIKYYIQTPNKNFPIEPHFVFPFFQFLPKWFKIALITNFSLGFIDRTNKQNAVEVIDSINMLSLKDLKKLFPEAKVHKERFMFFNKSYIAFWGF